jgi:hypothetical protein
MITGGSNFPTERNNKRNDIAHKRLTEYLDHRKAGIEAIRKAMHPEWRPIMSGDANASTRIETKLERLEGQQRTMVAVNKAIRHHAKEGAEVQVAAILAMAIPGLDEARARKLLEPDFCGRIGFPDYMLTNNSANIRRLKGRAVVVERLQAKPAQETEGKVATVEECPAENRVRLHFPGKPPVEVRTKLKSHGFRWTPSLGVWQAYYNDVNVAIAKEIAGPVEKEEEDEDSGDVHVPLGAGNLPDGTADPAEGE